MNGEKFIQFLQDDLVPMLQPFDGMNLNSIVVMGKYQRKTHRIAESACLSQLGMLKVVSNRFQITLLFTMFQG